MTEMSENRPKRASMLLMLHWAMMAMVVAMLAMGIVLSAMPSGDLKDQLIMRHASVGLLVLVVWVLRWGIGFFSTATSSIERQNAGAGRWTRLLYWLILLQALTGAARLLLAGEPIDAFGLFSIDYLQKRPALIAKSAALFHDYNPYLLLILIGTMLGLTIYRHLVVAKKGFAREEKSTAPADRINSQ